MINAQKVIQKLRRPPAVHNWVRNIKRRTDDTALSLFNTAINGPRHSLRQITDIIRNVVIDQLPDEQAFKCLTPIKDPLVRAYGKQILTAALPYLREKGFKGVEVFRDMVEYYRVTQDVNVPVRPTFVVNDSGKVIPYFVICWAAIALTEYQKRILTTMIAEAILSLEEFEGSDAVILCIPRHRFSKTERYVHEWKVSDYEPLTEDEKTDLFDRYAKALNIAEGMIIETLG